MNAVPSNETEVELLNRRVVAVDGGTATGKGRLVDELSRLLRSKGVPAIHLSTGSVYRGVTYAALEHARERLPKHGVSEERQVAQAVAAVRQMEGPILLKLAAGRQVELHGGVVWLDGAPALVDEQLKGPGVSAVIPHVAGFLPVREFVNRVTRRQINEFDGFLLIDGRDISNVVVPDAPLKLLLTVAPEVAAKRSIDEHTVAEIIARDEADRRHAHGALRSVDDPGENVIVLATDDHTPESARDHVYGLMSTIFPDLPAL